MLDTGYGWIDFNDKFTVCLLVSGFGCQVSETGDSVPETLYETSYEIPPGRNNEQIERRTSNVQYRTSNIDESVKSQNQTVLKKVQIQGVQILQS